MRVIRHITNLVFLIVLSTSLEPSYAAYSQGCQDPEYQQFMQEQLAHIKSTNKRRYQRTLREYEQSLQNNNNPYQSLSRLTRHLPYSGEFDDLETLNTKIELLFDHANTLRLDQRIAASAIDNFSTENHAVMIARAWLAYRQGDINVAFDALQSSVELDDSALMGVFGPDVSFIRQIYQDGHTEPVLIYLTKTEQFWKGKTADRLRITWRKMIAANCKIQFDSFDIIKVEELGL